MKKPPLHPWAGALLVLLGGLSLSALPLLPLAWPALPAPLDRLPGSVLLGAGLSLLAALGVGWRLRGARRRTAAQQAEHDTLAFEQEGLLQHLAELGEKAQREAEFAASTEAALRAELAAQAERLALVDAGLLRIELDAQGSLLVAAAGLEPGRPLRLGAGAREAMQAGQRWCGPLALPDGEVMLMQLQPLGAERFLGLGLPQTALWRQRAELQQALERKQEQLDGAQAGGWSWQLGSERVQLDRRALKLLGLTAAGSVEMDAARLTERFHADDLPAWRSALHRLSAGRDPLLHQQLRVRRGDGWAWLQLRATVTARDAAGQAQRLAGTLIDIGAPLAAAQRGHWLERVDQAVQQGLGAAGFVWQPDEDRWTWNSAAAALLGSAELAPELRLEQALQAVAEPEREATAALLLRVAGGGAAAEVELPLQGGLGQQRPVRLRAWVEQGHVIGQLALIEQEQALRGRAEELATELGLLREQLAQHEAAEQARQRALPTLGPEPVLSAQQLQQANAQGIDLKRGIARFQGRVGLYLRSAQAFATLAQGLPAQLRAGDDQAAQLALHSFKGLASTLGCERLAQWGAAGEQRLRSGQAIDADWLQAFEEQLAEGLGLLRSLAEPPPVAAQPSRPDWLQTLEQGIAAADPQLASWLDGQRGQLAPWLGDDLDRLAHALAGEDFAAARELLAARSLS